MPCNIGLLEFKTKKEAENYTRNIINTIGENTIDNTHIHYNFFIDLLNNHHKKESKIGCGVDAFIVTKNAYGNGYELKIKRIDGTYESFSWRDCANHTHKNQEQLIDVAMRNAINLQIQEFRNNNPEICANCKSVDKCDVDHKNPIFNDIKNNFLATVKYVPCEFDKELITHQQKFKKCDIDFETRWQKYHKENSLLQFLCFTCHKKKTKNDIKILRCGK